MIGLFAPATAHPDSIARPSCSECGTATFLVGIESERPGYELHTSALSARTLKLLLGKPRRRRSRLLRLGERYGDLPIDY